MQQIRQEPTTKEIDAATECLSPADYAAIGAAVVQCSWLELALSQILFVEKSVAENLPMDEQERLSKKLDESYFSERIKKTKALMAKIQISEANEIGEYLDKILVYRNFLCHGTIKKLNNGWLYGRFYDKKSTNDGPLWLVFDQAELMQLRQSAASIVQVLKFEIDYTNSLQKLRRTEGGRSDL